MSTSEFPGSPKGIMRHDGSNHQRDIPGVGDEDAPAFPPFPPRPQSSEEEVPEPTSTPLPEAPVIA